MSGYGRSEQAAAGVIGLLLAAWREAVVRTFKEGVHQQFGEEVDREIENEFEHVIPQSIEEGEIACGAKELEHPRTRQLNHECAQTCAENFEH